MDVEVRAGLVIPDSELQVRFTPSGGPGGQHANRSNTRVELTWHVALSQALNDADQRRLLDRLGPVVRVVVDDQRSQLRNRDIANSRLRARVLGALHEPRQRRKTKPSRSSQRRRVDNKKRRGQLKRNRRPPSRDD